MNRCRMMVHRCRMVRMSSSRSWVSMVSIMSPMVTMVAMVSVVTGTVTSHQADHHGGKDN